MIKVTNEVRLYEVNGNESQVDIKGLTVSNHWNQPEMVVLKFSDSQNTYTVSRRDLEAAIQNASNSNRF